MFKKLRKRQLVTLLIMLVVMMVNVASAFAEEASSPDDELAQAAEYYIGITDTGKVINGSLNPDYNPRLRATGDAGLSVSKTYGAYPSYTQIITVDGHIAYCIQPEKNVPSNTDYQEQVVNNAQLRTVLYYGYGGNDFAEFLNNVEGGSINNAYMDTWMAARIASGESISNPAVVNDPCVRWLLDHATAPDALFNVGNSPQNSSWVKSSQLQETGWYTTSGGGTFTVQVNGTGVGVQFQGDGNVYWTNQERTTGTSFRLVADKAKDGQVTINVPTTATGWAALLYVPRSEPNVQNVVGIGGGSDPIRPGQAVATFRRQEAQAKMKKVDKDTNLITGQGNASLEGAVFGLFSSDNNNKVAEGTITNGVIDFGRHLIGQYYLKEITPPPGYRANTDSYPINLEDPGQVYEGTVPNDVKRGGVQVQKIDKELNRAYGQGDGTIEGARFSIINKSAAPVVVDGVTAGVDEVCKVISTNASGLATTGDNSLPIGTYEIYESDPSTGYHVNGTWRHTFEITEDGQVIDLTKEVVDEQIIRGGVLVEKWDKELNKSEALGGENHGINENGSHLEGIEFTIKNTSPRNVLVEGKEYKPGEDVKKIYSRWDETKGKYIADTAANLLPYGSYSIRETRSTESYLLTDGSEHNFQIRQEGVIVTVDTGNNPLVIKDQVKRSDFHFIKIGNSDSVRLSVPWLVTNNTTGEKHIIVTDQNGVFNSATSHRAHSVNTNANDALMAKAEAGEVIKQSEMVIDSGLWFSQGESGSHANVNDALAAMPYGKYTLTELRCEANESYTLQKVQFFVYRDGDNIDLGTITNDTIDIWTEALDEKTEDHLAMAELKAITNDTVEIEGLKVGENYTVKARLVDVANGSDIIINGQPVTLEESFKAFSTKKKLNMEYEYDATSLAGKTVVAFVELYHDSDGRKVAVHADLDNEDQSIHYPKIETTLLDNSNNDHYAYAHKSVTTTDKVAYTNLIPGKTYTMKGKLMLESTGEPLIDNGKEVVAEQEFKAASANGFVDLTFTYNADAIIGDSVVAFETLEWRGHTVAVHADIDDEAQTVHYPKIQTSAVDANTGIKEILATNNVSVKDTVTYTNMPTDRVITMVGKLMDKKTGKVLVVGGNEVTKTVNFTPPSANGTVDIIFNFEATGLENTTYVVFEEAYMGNYLLADHKDINDEGQTVHFPRLRTTALDSDTDYHHSLADDKVTITDTVTYENLIPGNTYTMQGKVYLKTGANAGQPLLVGGQEVTAKKQFTPSKADGSVELTFTFNASALKGQTVVVYEDCYRGNVKVATHQDITDEDQSIHIPKIETTALDRVSGEHYAYAGDAVNIVDTVSYTNLIPGQEYTMKGKVMDQETGKELKVGGKSVLVERSFKPSTANGTIQLTFSFDASLLAGKTVVVYENCYWNGHLIATHEDINDAGQTVHFPKISTSAVDANTGIKEILATDNVSVKDTVSYENMPVNREITMVGKLMDKETSKVLVVNGQEVTKTVKFTPTKPEGTVDIIFNFDATGLENKTYVVFEEAYLGQHLMADHQDINDEGQTVHFPKLMTNALDSDTDYHHSLADDKVTITDTVTYQNLIPGNTYMMKGKVYLKTGDNAGEPLKIDGKEVTAQQQFTPNKADGTVALTFTFNASALKGETVVVFEDCYRGNVKVGTHQDITDEDQSIHIPKIETSLTDNSNNDHYAYAGESVTVTDKVTYTNLIPGQTYTMKGKLMLESTGKALVQNLKAITSEKTFVAGAANGVVELEFTFDAKAIAGDSVVAFEELEWNKHKIAVHADIDDEGQTVHYPKISTSAYDAKTGIKEILADGTVSVRDTVTYENMPTDREVSITGKLMDKETSKVLVVDGQEVTQTVKFTPANRDGEAEIIFTFNASGLENKTYVVFEKAYMGEYLLANHEDINDKAQTIYFPKLRTTALDSDTSYHHSLADDKVTIEDTVTYQNVIPGNTYIMKGKVYLKTGDNAGEPLKVDGKEVTAEKKFLALKADGTVKLTFTFDASALKGETVVVFEDCYRDAVRVGTHSDITDEEQSIHIPKIETSLTDNSNNDHYAYAGESVTVTDKVTYTNLIPGQTYTMKGKLMLESTGKALVQNLKAVTSEKTFVAGAANGVVELEFTFDAKAIAGDSVVAFEELEWNKHKIAVHADIDDEGQTVHYPKISTSAHDARTGIKEILATDNVSVRDTVSYENMPTDREVSITGRLMDKETGKVLVVGGQEVTQTVRFTPEKRDGNIDLIFTFDATGLENKTYVVFEKAYIGDYLLANHEDINDEGQTIHFPKIGTTAIDSDTDYHLAFADDKVTITDTVTYQNVIPGNTYIMKGKVYLKTGDNAGEPLKIDGKEITAEKKFLALKADGTVKLTFTFDASALKGETVVVFEDCYRDAVRVGTHSDITDEDQSIHIPKIETTALDKISGEHYAYADKEVNIVDTVAFTNLIPGQTYTMKGKLMDQATGKVLKVNGKEVTAQKDFKPNTANGTVDIIFTFDGSSLAGQTVVAFEDCYWNGHHVATHTEIGDEAQTVHFPKIGTTAVDEVNGIKEILANGEVSVKDTVKYENMPVNREITMVGKLMDKETGEVLVVNGQEVTHSETFLTEAANGEIDLTFTFDATGLEGRSYVVFEKAYLGEHLMADHEDINDEGQTIHFPKLRTSALDSDTDYHHSLADDEVTIIDTVTYQNLIPGNTYVMKGKVYLKTGENAGEPLVIDGKEVTAEQEFKAEKADDIVKLSFTFNASALKGETVVIFEDCYRDAVKVGTHSDLTDEGQSIHIPKIETTALDKISGEHYAYAGEEVTVVDTVNYTNLIPGETYTMKGVLMLQGSGKELVVNGKKVTAQQEFVPSEPNGSVELAFTFDGSALAGETVVAFEDCYWRDHLVGTHAEIEDEEQSVHFPKIGTSAVDGNTEITDILADGEVVVKDTVSYENMPVNREITMKGLLMDKETGEPLLINDQEVAQSVVFVPETADGTVDVLFTLDATDLAGKSLVVFEKAYLGEHLMANHEDIDDEGQTIRFPKIKTNALGKDTNDHYVDAGEETTIIDMVDYENLTPGSAYKMSGKLMIKNAEGLEEPLLVDGKEVTAEQEFVPEEAKGVVELSFTFNSSALVGKTVVAFENLYREGVKVGTHADINDVEQSVHVIKIGTQAWDKETMTKIMTQKEDSIILDTVTVEGYLYEDETYTMKATLMDKATAEALDKIGAERAFKLADVKPLEEGVQWEMITDANGRVGACVKGTIDVEIQINALEIANNIEADKEFVAFESLYTSKNPDTPIASHEDINDAAQTVIVKPAPGSGPDTGDDEMVWLFMGMALTSMLGLGVLICRKAKEGERE